MNNPQGSDFARFLLSRDFKGSLCAVSNIGDSDALNIFNRNRVPDIARIVDYVDDSFVDSNGGIWQYAVPIKISTLQQSDL